MKLKFPSLDEILFCLQQALYNSGELRNGSLEICKGVV